MSHICVDSHVLDFYKRKLAKVFPEAMSSHRLEAMASGFGLEKYASFRSKYKDQGKVLMDQGFSEEKFLAKLAELSGPIRSVEHGLVADVFSYRTFVAVQNGYSYELVEMLALGTGCDAFQAKIYAHALSSQAISASRQIVMPESSVMSTLTSIASANPVDFSRITAVEARLLEAAPYRDHQFATDIFFRMSSWNITMGSEELWGSFSVVEKVEMGRESATARVTLRREGVAFLRAAQIELDALKMITETNLLQKALATHLRLRP